jgi:hypothetical protein
MLHFPHPFSVIRLGLSTVPIYQFPALTHLKDFQPQYEEAQRKDVRFLELKTGLYARHNQEALRELNIRKGAMKDVLLAMQRVSLSIV